VNWVAAADYRRGANAHGPGQPCRAYGQVLRLGPDLMAGAVADCGDSTLHSYHTAKVAVRAALAEIADRPDVLSEAATDTWRKSADAVFRSALARADNELRQAIAGRSGPARTPETSLVVFAVTHQGTVAARVGNGMVIARGEDRAYRPLFDPDNEDRVSRTLHDAPALAQSEMEIAHLRGPQNFVCAATDALRALTSWRVGGASHRRFLRRLDRCATGAPTDTEVHHEIRSLLRSARIAPRIKDDLGVALCSYRPQADLFNRVAD